MRHAPRGELRHSPRALDSSPLAKNNRGVRRPRNRAGATSFDHGVGLLRDARRRSEGGSGDDRDGPGQGPARPGRPGRATPRTSTPSSPTSTRSRPSGRPSSAIPPRASPMTPSWPHSAALRGIKPSTASTASTVSSPSKGGLTVSDRRLLRSEADRLGVMHDEFDRLVQPYPPMPETPGRGGCSDPPVDA